MLEDGGRLGSNVGIREVTVEEVEEYELGWSLDLVEVMFGVEADTCVIGEVKSQVCSRP